MPWNGTPEGTPGAGNVPTYASGNIEIRNTDSADANKIQWIKVNDGNKQLLICDRVILRSLTWNALNSQGLIFGNDVTIDGVKYKLRSLTGSSNYRTGSDHLSGGAPTNNEWDQYITNERGLAGLLTPNTTDLANVCTLSLRQTRRLAPLR